MANLIPTSAKKDIVIEYWVRTVSVWCVLLGTVALVLTVLLAPLYLLIKNQTAAFASDFAVASSESASFIAAEQAITLANDTALLLVRENSTISLVDYLEDIERLAGQDVRIDAHAITQTTGNLTSFSVSGSAATREALVNFSESIKKDERFGDATVPLSNLAKNKDIPFTLTITPAP